MFKLLRNRKHVLQKTFQLSVSHHHLGNNITTGHLPQPGRSHFVWLIDFLWLTDLLLTRPSYSSQTSKGLNLFSESFLSHTHREISKKIRKHTRTEENYSFFILSNSACKRNGNTVLHNTIYTAKSQENNRYTNTQGNKKKGSVRSKVQI